MSIQSILNQNTALQVNATTQNVAGLTSYYITIPWAKASTIKRVFITSGQNPTGLTVAIVKNGAKHKATVDAATKASYIVAQKTGQDVVGGVLEVTFNDAYIEAESGYIYILISRGSAFPAGTVFNVSVEGTRRVGTDLNLEDENIYRKVKGYRVIMNGLDVTDRMIGNANATSGNQITENSTGLINSGDQLYIGADEKITKLELRGNAGLAHQFAISYWNGTTWVNVTTSYDNTADNFYSGTLEFLENAGVAWQKSILSNDPLVQLSNDVKNGLTQPVFVPSSNPKYWLNLSSGGDDVILPRIMPLK